jgi:very-short-patch-repair endonuclease/predicted nucleic acid-binding Zn ribbon protein
MPIVTKTCPVCGSIFQYRKQIGRDKLTCGRLCGAKLRWRTHTPSLSRISTVTKVCPVCGTIFVCLKRSTLEQQTCSPSCGARLRALRSSDHPFRRPRLRVVHTKICEHCQTIFHPKDREHRYCSKSCSALARWRDPVFRSRVTALLQRPRTAKQHRWTMRHVRQINRDPAIHEKSAAARRGRPFPVRRYRRGELTHPQQLLKMATGWSTEYTIRTGNSLWPFATVDLAHPQLKIAIECDGQSHHGRHKRKLDRRKTRILRSIGWTVLRFWNNDILSSPDRVLARIHTTVTALSSARSQSEILVTDMSTISKSRIPTATSLLGSLSATATTIRRAKQQTA